MHAQVSNTLGKRQQQNQIFCEKRHTSWTFCVVVRHKQRQTAYGFMRIYFRTACKSAIYSLWGGRRGLKRTFERIWRSHSAPNLAKFCTCKTYEKQAVLLKVDRYPLLSTGIFGYQPKHLVIDVCDSYSCQTLKEKKQFYSYVRWRKFTISQCHASERSKGRNHCEWASTIFQLCGIANVDQSSLHSQPLTTFIKQLKIET